MIRSDVAIIGAGFGGVAAALALLDRGYSVTLTEEFPWIGGQVSSQALCVLDDLNDPSGERCGVTRRYAEFRSRIRAAYTSRYKLSPLGEAQLHLCPGNARCSHLTAEPDVAHNVLLDWLRPGIASGKLTVLTGVVPVKASSSGGKVQTITVQDLGNSARQLELTADFFLDGSETGDTYPLLNLPYRIGSETPADFNEPHAAERADRSAVQCFTYCAVVEFVPKSSHVSPKPANYEAIRDRHNFYLSGPGATPEEPSYFFKPRILKSGSRICPFWFYRCVVDAANFENVTGRAVINVKCNDFNDAAYLESPQREQILSDARELTRAYIYWLQTEAPRDEGGRGYPELRLMPEATGTDDGIAQAPYVREGRRLVAQRTVIEQDLAVEFNLGSRARHFRDSVGLGGYAIDIHARSGMPGPSLWQGARPYQVPLSAMVAPALSNFAAAGKGIGVSQVANGAYRMHPSEWTIGEAAGELAAFCLANNLPNTAPLSGQALLNFQKRLVATGMPLFWFEDMPFDHPAFAASQLLAVTGIWPAHEEHLRFEGDQSFGRHRKVFLQVMEKLATAGVPVDALRESLLDGHNARKYDAVHRVMKLLDQHGWHDTLLA